MLLGAPLDEAKKARLDEALGWFDAMLKGKIFYIHHGVRLEKYVTPVCLVLLLFCTALLLT